MFEYRKKIIRPIDWIKKPIEDLLRLIGFSFYWLVKPFCPNHIKPNGQLSRFLLIRRNRLGDAISVLPLIQLLRQYYPDAVIDVLSNSYNQFIFKNSDAVDNIFVVPERYLRNRYLVRFHPELKRLRQQNKYDFVISATGAFSSATAWLALFSPGINKIGVVSQKQHIMNLVYNIQISQSSINKCKHQVEKIAFLAKYSHILGQDFEIPSPKLNKLPHTPLKHSVALCPMTNRKESKWSDTNWYLLSQLLGKNGVSYNWIGEKPISASGNLIKTEKTQEFIELLSQFDIVVCIEGGVSHIAPAVDCNTIVISGVNIAESWIPWSGNSVLFEQTGKVNEIKPRYVMYQILSKINKNVFLEENGAILNKHVH